MLDLGELGRDGLVAAGEEAVVVLGKKVFPELRRVNQIVSNYGIILLSLL